VEAHITRNALDRVPLSLIIDDSTVLVNLNYFWMRDRNPVDGQNRRWQDVPVVHPESFTREFAEFCLTEGVRGKFSIVPYPAALGRVDETLPLFGRAQQDSWMAMCRELIVPAFDITPEMLTHTTLVDPDTLQTIDPSIWEQYDWRTLPEDEPERVIAYISKACEILVRAGFSPQGVTSPGGFGGKTIPFYAKMVGEGVRQATGHDVPFFFQQVTNDSDEDIVDSPVWYADEQAGTAVGEIIASTGDWTGSWTGYGEVNADRYITADLQGGRLPTLIDHGQPAILISHWQGFYGMHDEDRRGFDAFKTVVHRLRERDPKGEVSRWQTCSQISRYACARQMAELHVSGDQITIDSPVRVPELTLSIPTTSVAGVTVDDKPLRRAPNRAGFESGTYLPQDQNLLVAFDTAQRKHVINVSK
jgi:hypothetical protein